MQRVFITGIGIIASIGNNSKESFESLCASKTGIAKSNTINTKLKNILPLGEVRLSNDQLIEQLELSKEKTFSRTSLLAIHAVKEAIEMAKITNQELRNGNVGIINSTSVGGMDKGEKFYNSFLNHPSGASLKDALVYDCGDSTEAIATHFNSKGLATTISTACSSSANAILYGTRLIKAGLLDKAIVGGSDALTLYTINGFNSLMILSDEPCKPFDQDRKGLNLGEGAGYLILESEKSLMHSGKTPLAEVTGYGNACDAFHQTASSADGLGAGLAMTEALAQAKVKPEEIDYINVHGTGTANNDLSEGRAIERIFESKIPLFSSTKSFTGHTLAAAGGIEAVISILALQHNVVFPNLNFQNKINELTISPVQNLIKERKLKNILSNSFGFGGNNTSILFSAC